MRCSLRIRRYPKSFFRVNLDSFMKNTVYMSTAVWRRKRVPLPNTKEHISVDGLKEHTYLVVLHRPSLRKGFCTIVVKILFPDATKGSETS
ncbi:hypothetical protein TNCV_3297111 [Trichonephila clavipes]|uniref:Uncharacterized protein n=1 Tax=Trichonephila clavipes TaxID=2585209 RepID=A0A8X6SXR3_TRICX|nr:hypothetical protein TNCV_3297111 [Trichonephila clavipes]